MSVSRLVAVPKQKRVKGDNDVGYSLKIIFSVFAASDLKKRVEKENLMCQYGTKPAGAEAIVHIFQQVKFKIQTTTFFQLTQ